MSSPFGRLFAVLLVVGILSPAPGCAAEPPTFQATEWLRQYLRFDTTNPPGNEGPAAAFLASILHREGIATQRLISPAGRTNLYARLPATAPSGEGAIVLLHHIDVVPAGPGWRHEPFAGLVEDGRIWGRGAIDAKSLGVAHVAAFLELAKSTVPRRRDLVLLATADEETGGEQGVSWLLDEHPELFVDVDAVLNEGGANRTIDDRLLWWGVEVVQKRPLWLDLTAQGRGGHASGYHPDGAPHRMARALARLGELDHELRISEGSMIFFGALAPLHGGAFQKVFDHQDPAQIERELKSRIERGEWAGLLPGMDLFLRDTLQITSFDSGGPINVVPATARATVDVRMLPDTDQELLLERIREALGPGIEIEILLEAEPQESSPVDHPVYRELETLLRESAPVVPTFILGTTDSRSFRARGIPAYGFWPFLLDREDNQGIHAVDESIPVVDLNAGVELMVRAVEHLVHPIRGGSP